LRCHGGLATILRQAEAFDLLESAVAIVDVTGTAVYQNAAFARFNSEVRDAPDGFGHVGCLLECTSVRASIEECLQATTAAALAQTFYYGLNIPTELTLVLRPVCDENSGAIVGVMIHIAEESIHHNQRQLIRLQHSARELTERVRRLSLDKRDSERMIRSLLKHSPFPMVMFNAKRQILHMNQAAETLFGATLRNCLGQPCENFFDCYHINGCCPVMQRGREIKLDECMAGSAEQSAVPVLRSIVTLTDMNEPIILEAFIDLSERKRAEAEREKLSRAVEQTADSVIITDRDGVIEFVNPAFEETTGYTLAEAKGKTPGIIKSGKHDAEFYKKLWGTIKAGEVFRDVLINRKKDGTHFYEEKTITPLKDNQGNVTHFISTGKDITERMQTQERLQYLAYHDILTELPNRALLTERLEHALARARWTKRLLAVMFLDLDRFKIINDTLGHETGDRLLQELAKRLRDAVREGDTVARLSGDEFAILLEDVATTDDIGAVARKVLAVFSRPFKVSEQELFVTSSIGVSVYPADGDDVVTLLRHADTAMYRAKEQGKNNYQFYSSDMGAKAVERLALETGLRRALERREFVLHFQPQINLETGRISGAEALIRWQHQELGLVPPGDFIPLLEETGLIMPVGEWVIETACNELCRWRSVTAAPLLMTINLSARQFADPELAQKITRIMRDCGIEPSAVEFEITESVIMENAARTIETLNALSDMGFRFAIDDFGTGYSSLSYLKRFAINTLKVDRSFVRDIPGDPDDSAIVSTIVAMAHSLKIEVIAEGVETEEQLAFLRACGCDGYQGYLFSRPVPADDFVRLLQGNLTA